MSDIRHKYYIILQSRAQLSGECHAVNQWFGLSIQCNKSFSSNLIMYYNVCYVNHFLCGEGKRAFREEVRRWTDRDHIQAKERTARNPNHLIVSIVNTT